MSEFNGLLLWGMTSVLSPFPTLLCAATRTSHMCIPHTLHARSSAAWRLQAKDATGTWVNAETLKNEGVSWTSAETKCFEGDNVNPNGISSDQ